MKIVVIGLGLIGGSLAKAFKHYTDNTVIGCDKDKHVTESALACGAVDEISEQVPKDADIYFLAMSPTNVCGYVDKNINAFCKGSIITDVCGIKCAVTKKLEDLAVENGLYYIGGHPMAGREVNSFYNSDFDLFDNRSYLISKTQKTNDAAVQKLCNLISEIGVSGIKFTTPETHDRMIAFTSQLPHIIAGSYMKSPQSREHNGYSAGSYYDVSRVATIDENLWTELFLDNKENISNELEIMINNLKKYKSAIDSESKSELCDLIKESRILKEKDQKINGAEIPHKFG